MSSVDTKVSVTIDLIAFRTPAPFKLSQVENYHNSFLNIKCKEANMVPCVCSLLYITQAAFRNAFGFSTRKGRECIAWSMVGLGSNSSPKLR